VKEKRKYQEKLIEKIEKLKIELKELKKIEEKKIEKRCFQIKNLRRKGRF
jgi:hypothetical protein